MQRSGTTECDQGTLRNRLSILDRMDARRIAIASSTISTIA